MKKLLTILCAAFVTSAAFGQGYILLNNGTTSRVYNGREAADTRVPLGTPVGLFLVAPGAERGVGGTLVLGTNTYTATGLFNSGQRDIGMPVGATPAFQVRAWLGAAAWEDATQTYSTPTFISPPLGSQTSPGPATQPFIPGPMVIVPEPSTIALGLLGLGAIALFRRKK